nr:aminoglycoside 6'-N-acetyltransferase [Providencia alcalifaciens]
MTKVCTSELITEWLALRLALWSTSDESSHLSEIKDILNNPNLSAFFAFDDNQQIVAFAETSIRVDYVNDCSSSPVAYLEGIYTAPHARKRGYAKDLINHVKQLAIKNTCKELASDTNLDNEISQKLHQSLGFIETERIVFYKQQLSDW